MASILDRRQFTAFLVWALTAISISTTAYVYWRAAAPAYVHVRWIPGVDERERVALEQKFRLIRGEFLENRTWSYRIMNASSENLDAILRDPHVEDTDGIDRASFQVVDSPTLRAGLASALLVGFGTSTVGWWAWSRLRTSTAGSVSYTHLTLPTNREV